MKDKLIIISVPFLLLSTILYSQKSSPVYFKIYGAYGLLSPGSFKGEQSRQSTIDTNFFKVGKKGFGEGIRIGAGFGFIVSDYVNAGLDAEYLKGTKMNSSIDNSYDKTTVTSSTSINHAIVSIIPNVTFKAVSRPSYYIYNRIGLVIGIPLDITEDYNYYQRTYLDENPVATRKAQKTTTEYHAEYKLKTGIGYQAALGMQIRVSDHLKGFWELTYYRLSLSRIQYEEIYRTKKVVITRGFDEDLTGGTIDRSRNIILFKNEGSNFVERQGSDKNYTYTYTKPQSEININAVIGGLGIFYRL